MFFEDRATQWIFSWNQSEKATARINAPIKNPKNDRGFDIVTLELLEPYDVIRYLFMEAQLDIPQRQVHEFWDHWRAVGAEWALHTSASRDHIPLGLYGDSARVRQPAFGELRKALGIFLNLPLYRPRSIRMSRWLIFSIDEKHLYKDVTLDIVLRRITWSINLLFQGQYPSRDLSGAQFNPALAGKDICGGKRFAVTELRGDQLWHKQVWKFKASWKGGVNQSVCCQCDVRNRGSDAYYKIDEGNELGHEFSLLEFINQQLPNRRPCHLVY